MSQSPYQPPYPPEGQPPPGGPQGYPPPPPADGPPQFGAPPYGMPGQPPPKKNKALKIVLIVVLAVVLLCIAGGTVAWFAFRDKFEEIADGATVTVVEPATLGGRPKVTIPAMTAAVSEMRNGLTSIPGKSGQAAGAYGNPLQQDLVMFAAAATVQGSAQSRFTAFTADLKTSSMKVPLTDTDPGPLGGIAQCGETVQSGQAIALCVWSDNGSTGTIMMAFKNKAALEKEFVALRGEVEKKG